MEASADRRHAQGPPRARLAPRERGRDEAARALAPPPRELLAPGRRRELLELLLRRDRVAVAARVARALAERALLLDAAAVALRVFGRLAATLDASEPYASAAERAIAEVVEESARDSREGRDDDLPPPGEAALVGTQERARAACAAFNRLPEPERRALYHLAVRGASVAGAASSLRLAQDVVASHARRALLAILEATASDGRESLP